MTERRTEAGDGAGLLVVEDDPRIAAVLVKGLRKRGFDSAWVMTGAEAISRVEAGDVDLLLLDLGLPDIDGLDVLRTLRERGIAPAVIVITARSDPSDRAAALALGASAYFTKPFKWAEVWAAVGRCGLTPKPT
jgi:two-component system response regulator QseB